VLTSSQMTDVDGRAENKWTLGPTPGPQRLEARAADEAVVFRATALSTNAPNHRP
jgi:hypothetical protein